LSEFDFVFFEKLFFWSKFVKFKAAGAPAKNTRKAQIRKNPFLKTL